MLLLHFSSLYFAKLATIHPVTLALSFISERPTYKSPRATSRICATFNPGIVQNLHINYVSFSEHDALHFHEKSLFYDPRRRWCISPGTDAPLWAFNLAMVWEIIWLKRARKNIHGQPETLPHANVLIFFPPLESALNSNTYVSSLETHFSRPETKTWH